MKTAVREVTDVIIIVPPADVDTESEAFHQEMNRQAVAYVAEQHPTTATSR